MPYISGVTIASCMQTLEDIQWPSSHMWILYSWNCKNVSDYPCDTDDFEFFSASLAEPLNAFKFAVACTLVTCV